MPISDGLPTSRRGYLSQNELAQFADINITDTTEADDRISQAEELIDAYVGYVKPFLRGDIVGLAQAGSTTSITLESTHQNAYNKNYFSLCHVEIIGGTGAGQRRKCTSSTYAGVLTTETWSTAPDSTSFYRIFQLGKFPRAEDVYSHNSNGTETIYKAIPEEVKRAVAAQVQYVVEMGDRFFATDSSDKTSERIGDYSYSKGEGQPGSASVLEKLLAPKARQYLRGFTVRYGQFEAENTAF